MLRALQVLWLCPTKKSMLTDPYGHISPHAQRLQVCCHAQDNLVDPVGRESRQRVFLSYCEETEPRN